tara:strand:- start:138 stop:611 length:474 start_codon:yes stop_codon:yes gene_type:complete
MTEKDVSIGQGDLVLVETNPFEFGLAVVFGKSTERENDFVVIFIDFDGITGTTIVYKEFSLDFFILILKGFVSQKTLNHISNGVLRMEAERESPKITARLIQLFGESKKATNETLNIALEAADSLHDASAEGYVSPPSKKAGSMVLGKFVPEEGEET